MIGHRPNQEGININNTDESFEDIEVLLKRRQCSSEMKQTPLRISSTTYFEIFFYCLRIERNNILSVYFA